MNGPVPEQVDEEPAAPQNQENGSQEHLMKSKTGPEPETSGEESWRTPGFYRNTAPLSLMETKHSDQDEGLVPERAQFLSMKSLYFPHKH